MVTLLVVLAITPLVSIYVFSVNFINRGIDELVQRRRRAGARQRARSSARPRSICKSASTSRSLDASRSGSGTPSAWTCSASLADLLRQTKALELTVFGANNQILATSSDRPGGGRAAVPERRDDVSACAAGNPYVTLEPQPDGQYQIITAVQLPSRTPGTRAARARSDLPGRAALERPRQLSCRRAMTNIGELSYLAQRVASTASR